MNPKTPMQQKIAAKMKSRMTSSSQPKAPTLKSPPPAKSPPATAPRRAVTPSPASAPALELQEPEFVPSSAHERRYPPTGNTTRVISNEELSLTNLTDEVFRKLQQALRARGDLRLWRDHCRLGAFIPHSHFHADVQSALADYLLTVFTDYSQVAARVQTLAASVNKPISVKRLVVYLIILEAYSFHTSPDLAAALLPDSQESEAEEDDIELSVEPDDLDLDNYVED